MKHVICTGWKHGTLFEKVSIVLLSVTALFNVTVFGFTRDWNLLALALTFATIAAFNLLCAAQRNIIDTYAPLAAPGYVLGRALEAAKARGVNMLTITYNDRTFTITEEATE